MYPSWPAGETTAWSGGSTRYRSASMGSGRPRQSLYHRHAHAPVAVPGVVESGLAGSRAAAARSGLADPGYGASPVRAVERM